MKEMLGATGIYHTRCVDWSVKKYLQVDELHVRERTALPKGMFLEEYSPGLP